MVNQYCSFNYAVCRKIMACHQSLLDIEILHVYIFITVVVKIDWYQRNLYVKYATRDI